MLPTWMRRPRVGALLDAVMYCRILALRNAARLLVDSHDTLSSLGADAVLEVDRLMALEADELRSRLDALPKRLRIRQRFDLECSTMFFDDYYASGMWIIGLFRLWLRERGAALMRGNAFWHSVLRGDAVTPHNIPLLFSLDGENARVTQTADVVMHVMHAGRAPLDAAWWRLTWDCACREVGI